MTPETFRQLAAEVESGKAAVARQRAGQRKIDRNKLLTQHVFNELAAQGADYKYFYRGREHTVSPKQLRQSRAKETKHFRRAGTNIKALIRRTDNLWVSRARLQIQTARLDKITGDRFVILTGKTSRSKWKKPFHRTVVQLKEYGYFSKQPPGKDGYKTNAQAAIQGSVGVYCDCEDFQFRRNYWVTQIGADVTGDPSIKPETAFPKIVHPTGERGPLCVHLVKACEAMIHQPRMVDVVARLMKKEAKSVAPGPKTVKATKKDYEAMEELTPAKVDALKNQWLDRQGRKLFKKYQQAAQSFSKHGKKVLSKKAKEVEKKVEEVQAKLNRAEAKQRAAIQNMLKMKMTPEQIAGIYDMPVQDVKKLV